MNVSVFCLSVCLSVFGWGVCVRGMGMMSPRSGREGDDGRGVVVEDGGAERDRGVRGGGLSDGYLPYRLAYLYDVASLGEIEVITLVHTVDLEYPDLHPSHIIHTERLAVAVCHTQL